VRLKNKVAIITGGNRGIGRAIALAFAREGVNVAIVGRDKSRCHEVAAEINKNGGVAIGIQADVSSEADVARMVKQTKDKFQRIDILVNNAGINLPYRPVSELSLEEWNQVIGTNQTGTFLCSRAVLPEMMAQRSGKIINMSSYGGKHGAAGRSPYRTTKAAIINFTECLAAEVKQYGIDVNAILPALVATNMLKEIMGNRLPDNVTPPEEIADLAVFLASDESKSVSGTAIEAYGTSNPLFGEGKWTYVTE
jgi:NAD(P)-dependent dehydrogenase (short-subunit alcohol dehydrogenase family)